MAVKNIFTSVDVVGLCEKWGKEIMKHYGLDPRKPIQKLITQGRLTGQYVFNEELSKVIESGSIKPFRINNAQNKLPDYVRLISSKSATIGYELLEKDIETKHIGGVEKRYLTNTYNLSIEAKNGDTIIWWGNAITPNSSVQAVVTKITNAGSRQPLSELKDPITKNVQFKYPAIADGEYYNIQTHQTFSYQGQILGHIHQTISYDIHLDLVSDTGCVFVRFFCDPHIYIVN